MAWWRAAVSGVVVPSPDRRTRLRAVLSVSRLLPALLILAAMLFPLSVAPIATAAIAGALAQVSALIRAGHRLPGTTPGLILMLPAAIWLFAALDWPVWPAAASAALSPLALRLIWQLAANRRAK
ncbi:MAG: hypothetical protein Q4G22_07820 [Paracoccus sp. (in: a-proteobacteria)]|uniref:hypothetical protein n=1 Tax=Paracoccus sp. TaxID=267 RepID=UPI0026E0B9A1|nr:hypothetical protein [Paracoccus sp. (in: a-proteobacteria)]MDO5631730.1 hypothetical protein [Paracoccus sp. (in: a-proteobacteria)]